MSDGRELWKRGETIIIYGAGTYLQKRYKFICENYRVEAIVDKNKRGDFQDVPICGLEYLNKRSASIVIIMIENRNICMDIADTLISEYGISRDDIRFGVNLVSYRDKEKIFKVGIMGCGSIASQMATAILNICQDIKIHACASRTQEKADSFAYKYGIEKAYGNYSDMLKDDELDIIYIATPTSEHFSNMKQCIEHGKNILCEKTFTINEKQTKEVFALAKERSLYVAEAMTIQYHEIYSKLKQILLRGIIGDVINVQASINYKVDALDRIKDIKLGGGALFELGVYNLNFMTICMGYDVAHIIAHSDKFEAGADAYLMLIVQYKNGKTAGLYCDTRCSGKNQGIVYGNKGFIIIDEINRPSRLLAFDNDKRLIEEYYSDTNESVLANEMITAKIAIEKNELECAECSQEHTISIMQMMDKVRSMID